MTTFNLSPLYLFTVTLILFQPTHAGFWDYMLGESADEPTDVNTWTPDETDFRCNLLGDDSLGTLEQSDLCDGVQSCRDSSDESDVICQKLERCPPNKFHCPKDNICLETAKLCDGVSDCVSDSADERENGGCKVTKTPNETKLKCPDNRFLCEVNFKCLEAEVLCDFKKDCDDGSDESDDTCPTGKLCPKHTFHCYKTGDEEEVFSHHCIPMQEVCNLITDCPNGEDEKPDLSPCKPSDLFEHNHTHHVFKDFHHNAIENHSHDNSTSHEKGHGTTRHPGGHNKNVPVATTKKPERKPKTSSSADVVVQFYLVVLASVVSLVA